MSHNKEFLLLFLFRNLQLLIKVRFPTCEQPLQFSHVHILARKTAGNIEAPVAPPSGGGAALVGRTHCTI